MATNDELNDLRERIGRLSTGEQAWLLEAVLADNRRRCDDEDAAREAAIAESLEHERVLRELDRQRAALAGEKRAAG